MTSQYLWNLSEAIALMHDCSVSHSGTVTVIEKVEDETAFNGKVDIFDIEGHPKANKAFGWGWNDDDGEIQYIGILNVPPIELPSDAVRAAIASGKFL